MSSRWKIKEEGVRGNLEISIEEKQKWRYGPVTIAIECAKDKINLKIW